MSVKHLIKTSLITISMITLAACSAHKHNDTAAIDNANAAYSNDNGQAQATSSGLGESGNGFGDEGVHGKRVSNRIYYFDFNSNVVHDVDKPAIAANARYLVTHARAKVLVEGHTDPRGSREYNIGLGERRAQAVAEILKAKGVGANQIRIVSYGAEKLATPGHSEADYQQDRRVVLVYLQR